MNQSRQCEQQLTPAQAAARLGVDVSTVFRLIKGGRISPVYKLGHSSTRVPESALVRYLESCRVDTGSIT